MFPLTSFGTQQMEQDNPFEILGIENPYCDNDVIKKAYREKALISHPDKQKTGQRGAIEFSKVQNAFEQLRDPENKRRWQRDFLDRQARRSGPAQGPNSDFWTHTRKPDGHDPKFKNRDRERETELRISFEEAYTGCKKPVKAKVKLLCPCREYSWSSEIDPVGLPGQLMTQDLCPMCGGTWEVEEERNLSVFFPRGSYTGFKTKPLESVPDGVVLKARVDPPRPSLYGNYDVRRHRNDIYYSLRDELGTLDAFSLERTSIVLPSGRPVTLDLTNAKLLARLMPKGLDIPWKYRSSVMLRNVGFPSADRRFPNGNVYVIFRIDTGRGNTGAPLHNCDDGVLVATESVAFMPYEHGTSEDKETSNQSCVQQ